MGITFSHAGNLYLVDGEKKCNSAVMNRGLSTKKKKTIYMSTKPQCSMKPQNIFTSSSSTHDYVTVNL